MNIFTHIFNPAKAHAYYLEWTDLVMLRNPNRIVLPYPKLQKLTAVQINDDQRIMNDCFAILGKTTKPDTFFSRLDLLVEKAKHLSALANYAKQAGYKPNCLRAISNSASMRYNYVIQMFLNRYFSETANKAESLKTEKARIGRYQKFYDSLQEYYCYMNKDHIDYIETEYARHIKNNQ